MTQKLLESLSLTQRKSGVKSKYTTTQGFLMKKFLIAALAVLSFSAFAAPQIEVGLGFAAAQKEADGTWFQEKFPYQVDLRTKTWSIGVTDDINEDWRWHVAYVNLGKYSADAIATTDADYNPNKTPACNATPCVAQTRFVGNGTTNGLKATAEWHTKGDIQYGVSFGLFAFKPTWDEVLTDWTDSPTRPVVPGPLYHSIQSKWSVRPTFGVGIRKGDWEGRLDYYNTHTYSSQDVTIMKSVTTLSLIYRF
jgi:hypothetical protein